MNTTAAAVVGKNVSFRYQNNENNVIDCCSFSFNQGEITAVVGKNGEGKTTLGKLCASILKPTSGDIFLYGKNTKTLKLPDVAKELCYCFQSPSRQLFADTAEEEIAFALKYKKITKKEIDYIVDQMLDLFGLNEVRKSYPLRLSGGEQQRLAIAAGLALKPKFLLLDEPTSGLDKARIDEFSAMLKKLAIENNMGIAIISHDKDFVDASANRILCVKEGKVYAK